MLSMFFTSEIGDKLTRQRILIIIKMTNFFELNIYKDFFSKLFK